MSKYISALAASTTTATALYKWESNFTPTKFWSGGGDTFDCLSKGLIFDYAGELLFNSTDHFVDLDRKAFAWEMNKALGLYGPDGPNPQCAPMQYDTPTLQSKKKAKMTKSTRQEDGAQEVWVDYTHGSDTGNDGRSQQTAFKTVKRALDFFASTPRSATGKTMHLAPGVHYLNETLEIGPEHSGVTMQGQGSGDDWAVLSGAVPLVGLAWKPYKIKSLTNTNAYMANLSQMNVELSDKGIPGLRVNGVRATVARFPNGNPELPETSPNGPLMIQQYYALWSGAQVGSPEQSTLPNVRPGQTRPVGQFSDFKLGKGASCDKFDPPISYWCNYDVQGGLGPLKSYASPTNVQLTDDAVADDGDDDPNAGLHFPYKTLEGAELWAYHNRNANWVFTDLERQNGTDKDLKLGKGGFQEARGGPTGGDYAITNVFEEFDFPNEYFWDKTAQVLYYYHNGTETVQPEWTFEATKLATLISIKGSSASQPVSDFSITNVKLTDTRTTYMDPHGVPSAGDWALHRGGAVYMENTEGCSITESLLSRLDANGVMIYGYNRDVKITRNHFAWLGGSAVSTWGATEGGYPADWEQQYPGLGVNASAGNIPLRTEVGYNLCREIGIYTKQASCYFHAQAAQSHIHHNVMFNGPRAAVNFNDGLGGGDVMEHNVVFSMVRETTDHGPFNSWDRQPYITDLNTAQASDVQAWRQIRRNVMVNNYDSKWNIDNDDGSCYFNTTHNVFIGSVGAAKEDLAGHDLRNMYNMYFFTQSNESIVTAAGRTGFAAGHEDWFVGNTLYFNTHSPTFITGCPTDPSDAAKATQVVVSDNTVYTPTGVDPCGEGTGHQYGNRGKKIPADITPFIAQAKAMLVEED